MKILALAALAAAALGASLATASAGQLVVSSNYQDYSQSNCNSSSCKLLFTAIPTGKTAIVTDVNCTFVVKTGHKPFLWELLGRKPTTSGVRRMTLTRVEETSTTSYTYYTMKAEGRQIYVAGDTPEIGGLVFNTAGGSINPGNYNPNCTISGVLQ